MYRHYKPAHSGYLIHWTGGKDIDAVHDPDWPKKHSSITTPAVTALYLERLKYILKYGLWMTKNPEDEFVKIGKIIKRPYTARTCFTELKLSAVRAHAADYGRLGIGFKRPFLFNRLGAPMIYFHSDRKNWFYPPFSSNPTSNIFTDYFACFLKHMNEKSEDGTQQFKYYDESEWRIIYSDEIANKLKELNANTYSEYFSKPSDVKNDKFQEYIKQDGRVKPEYLISIKKEQWFCMIIYPSLAIKIEAEADKEIRDLIEDIKPTKPSNSKDDQNNKPASLEKHSKPIEIDLDACRNF